MTYDQKCEALARAFLADYPALDADEHAPVLAGVIQVAIEEYFEDEYFEDVELIEVLEAE